MHHFKPVSSQLTREWVRYFVRFWTFLPEAPIPIGALCHPPSLAPPSSLSFPPLGPLPSSLLTLLPTAKRIPNTTKESGSADYKTFLIQFEPRNRVWFQRFWFFFCKLAFKNSPDVLKVSPVGILICAERSHIWAI